MSTLPIRYFIASLMVALAVFAYSADVPAGERGIVAPSRPGHATPWVERHADERDTVIPLAGIPMLEGVPQRTPYYEIDSDVVEVGYFYHYYVRGKRQDYMVESTVELFLLLHELAILEELAKYDPAGEFFIGIGQGVKGMGIGIGNLVTKPGQTFRNIGNWFGRSFQKKPKVGKDELGEDRSLLGAGPAGSARRSLAYQYHLDVYTDNPEVKQVLNSLARARMSGSVTSWVIPFSGVAIFAAPGVRDDTVEQLIRDLDPSGLRQETGKRLAGIFGQQGRNADDPVGRLMRNPNYTPHQIAYIGKCLAEMTQVGGLGMLLEILAQIETPETADLAYLDLRLHHIMHTKVRPLAEYIELENLVAARGVDGVLYFIFPGDVLNEQTLSAAEVEELVREAGRTAGGSLFVAALGVVKPEFAQMLEQRGVRIHQNILRDPRFFSSEY